MAEDKNKDGGASPETGFEADPATDPATVTAEAEMPEAKNPEGKNPEAGDKAEAASPEGDLDIDLAIDPEIDSGIDTAGAITPEDKGPENKDPENKDSDDTDSENGDPGDGDPENADTAEAAAPEGDIDIDLAIDPTGGASGAGAEAAMPDDPIAVLTEERDKLKDQVLRALAEVENMRSRTEREVSQAKKYGHGGFARDLLSVVDNLGRAVAALPEDRSELNETMSNLVVGVEMIEKEIFNVLERHGITRIDPLGEKFDYDRHQAMFEVEDSDVEPGTVVQVAQPGWALHDRLLTPAMVGVAKAPADGKAAADKGEDG